MSSKRISSSYSLEENIQEEEWSIKNLPFDWECVPKRSKALERMQSKREKKHAIAIEQMKAKFDEVNCFVENQIRKVGDDLKETVLIAQTKASDICEKFEDIENNDQFSNVTYDDIAEACENILKLEKYSTESIENFNSYLKCLEKLRSERFKSILQETYVNLYEIQYLPPLELEKFFEEQIVNINEIMMNNFRLYTDLYSKILSQNEHTILTFYYRMNFTRDNWKKHKRKEFLSNVTTSFSSLYKIWEDEFMSDELAKKISTALISTEKHMDDLLSKQTFPVASKDINTMIKELQKTVDYMDKYSKILVDLYKQTIEKVLNGYIDDLAGVKERMINQGIINLSDIKLLESEVFKMSGDIDTSSDQLIDVIMLEKNRNFLTQTLKEKLEKPYWFLSRSAFLWDGYLDRIREAKELVLKDVKKLIAKNDSATLVQEIGMNIALDKLRQKSTEEELNAGYGEIIILLDKIKKRHLTNYESELKILSKYSDISAFAIEILGSELKLFLSIIPKSSVYHHQEQEREIPASSNDGILQRINIVEHKIKAVENWMSGLRETIALYEKSFTTELTTQAKNWIEVQTKQLSKRLEIKLCFHESRYERAKINVYDQRLAEIRKHEEILQNHKKAVETEIERMKDDVNVYQIQTQGLVAEFNAKVDSIKSKIKKCKSESEMRCLISELTVSKKNYLKEVEELKIQREKVQKEKTNKYKKAGTLFALHIRLFSEDGNFSIVEAKSFIKSLKNIEKFTNRKHLQVMSTMSLKCTKASDSLVKLANDSVKPFLNVLQEFVYSDSMRVSVENLQTKIKNTAIDLKSLMKLKQAEFYKIRDSAFAMMQYEGGRSVLTDELKQLLANLKELCNLLYHPQALRTDYAKYFTVPNDITSIATITSPQKSRKSSISLYSVGKMIIAKTPNEHEDSIMAKFCTDIKTSFAEMVEKAQKFYANVGSITNKDIVNPTFEEELVELVPRLNYYYLQCEGYWLEQANNLFEIFNDVQAFLLSVDSIYIKKLQRDFKDRSTVNLKEIRHEIENIIMESIGKVKKIHKILRPIHGSLANRDLLEKLQNDFYVCCENEINTMNILPQPYEENLIQEVNQHSQLITKMHENLQPVKTFLKSFADLISPIVPQFEIVLDNIMRFVNEDTVSEFDLVSEKVHYYKKLIPIPPNYSLNLNNSKIILKELSENSENLSCSLSFQSSEDAVFGSNIDILLQKTTENIQDFINVVIQMKTDAIKTIEEDRKIFDADVQAILNLYVLKYDGGGKEPEDATEKPKRSARK